MHTYAYTYMCMYRCVHTCIRIQRRRHNGRVKSVPWRDSNHNIIIICVLCVVIHIHGQIYSSISDIYAPKLRYSRNSPKTSPKSGLLICINGRTRTGQDKSLTYIHVYIHTCIHQFMNACMHAAYISYSHFLRLMKKPSLRANAK